MASISLSVGGPSFTVSPFILFFLCEQCHRIKKKRRKARPSMSSKEEILRVGLTPKRIKEEDPGEGLFQLSSGSIWPGSGDAEWFGANDLSGFLLPAVGHPPTERGRCGYGLLHWLQASRQ